MKTPQGNYAAYRELTPAIADTTVIAKRAEEIFGRIKAKEEAEKAKVQKKYEDYLKDLADFSTDFNEADVNYRFKTEMTRAGNAIRDELYGIHKKKTHMEHFGGVGSKEYEELTLREQQLNTVPEMFQKTFDSYNNLLTEYYAGKGTKYDDMINGPMEAKLVKAMNNDSMRFNEKTLKFEVKDPDTGDVKSMSAGQFSLNPLVFGKPKSFINIPDIARKMAGEIGVESRSYFDPSSNSQITIKRSEATGYQRKLVFDHVLNEIRKQPDLVEKLALNNLTPIDYAEDIMTAAQFKSGTYKSNIPRKSSAKGPGDYWDKFPPETVDSVGVAHYGEGKEYGIKNKALNSVSFVGSKDVAINPASVFIMNTSSPLYVSRAESGEVKGKDPTGKDITIQSKKAEVINGRTLTETSSGIQSFAFQRAQQMNIYQGDAAYRIKFKDEDGKPVSMILTKGKELPLSLLEGYDGEVSLENLGMGRGLTGETEYSISSGGIARRSADKGEAILPVDKANTIESIRSNSQLMNMAVGKGKIAGNELLIAIPMDEANKAAISTINATTRTGAFKDSKGFLFEWRDKYGASKNQIDQDVEVPQVQEEERTEDAPQEAYSAAELADKTAEELMAMDPELSEEDAKFLAGKTESEIQELLQ